MEWGSGFLIIVRLVGRVIKYIFVFSGDPSFRAGGAEPPVLSLTFLPKKK